MLKNSIIKSHYQQPPWWMRLLLPLSWCYELAVGIRLQAYALGLVKTTRVSVPIISIGNLTTGGTGKTPVIIALAEQFIAQNKTVVILSRGYGASEPIDYGEPTSPAQGDEAWLIKENLPKAIVIVGKNRSKNAQQAIKDYQPHVILLDDGYQHIKLERDINILLIDGHQMMGNGLTLPLGPMREPFRELKRADAFWVTKTNQVESYHQAQKWRSQYAQSPQTPVAMIPFERVGFKRLSDGQLMPLETLTGQNVLTFSGIAKPTLFQHDLERAGVQVVQNLTFPDHHNYSVDDFRGILDQSKQSSGESIPIVTTEKDRVKIQRFLGHDSFTEAHAHSMYTLVVRPVITPEALPESLQLLLSPAISSMEKLSRESSHAKFSK